MRRGIRFLGLIAVVATLAACESSEEKAEAYYQSGLELLAEGDVERALVEFRNVFQLDSNHRDARTTFARLQRERGDLSMAYKQYLRLVEQYPEDAEGRLALSQMAFVEQSWDEFDRHGTALVSLTTDTPEARTIEIGLAYRAAVQAEDLSALRDTVRDAQTLAQDLPEDDILRTIKINGALTDNDFDTALAEIDAAIAQDPELRQLYTLRLQLLARMRDSDGIEEQLRQMTTLFPEDNSIREMLIRYYVGNQQLDKAEAFIRSISAPDDEDPSFYLTLVQFISQTKGLDAAITELDKAIAADTSNGITYITSRAELNFELGNREEAIANLQEVVASSEPSDKVNDVKVILARMLLNTGNEVGARRLVEEALTEDPTQVYALKMQAAWLIESDEVDQAINALRTALDQSPQDFQAMTLMAEAYVRAGNTELSREFLSLAVDASRNAPEPSIRYANTLILEDRLQSAEDTLLASLRVTPNDLNLLIVLGDLYLRMDDFSRTQQVIDTISRLEMDTAKAQADRLRVELLNRRSGPEEAIAFLQELADEGEGSASTRAKVTLILGQVRLGNTDVALASARAAVAEAPDSLDLRLVLAAVFMATQDWPEAEAEYREVLNIRPDAPRVWLELVRTLSAQGRFDDARATMEEGLAANAGSPDLLWSKASYLENDGDFDGAIEIYESLYAQSSQSVIIANNLASLLSTWRDDPESLERAYNIARRLRSVDNVPAFQDTYGWIAYRRGNIEEALEYLEPAATGLPNDPVAQYHLAMAYLAADRSEEAKEAFRKAIEIAGDGDSRPQIVDAREKLNTLQ